MGPQPNPYPSRGEPGLITGKDYLGKWKLSRLSESSIQQQLNKKKIKPIIYKQRKFSYSSMPS